MAEPARTGAAGILAGIARIATGRADGVARFGGTVQAYLSSLAPMLAFLIVGTLLRIAQDPLPAVLRDALAAAVALLAPAVLSHALAAAWGREEGWLRYSVAYNWCQWALLPAMLLILVVLGAAVAAGVGLLAAGNAALFLLGTYALWLHWVLSRAALGLARWRAAAFVLLVNLGTAVLVFGPSVLAAQLNRAS